MNKQTKHLSTIGRVATPAAMVVFMAHEITTSMSVTGWWSVFVLFGAVLTSVGIEIVGILSGSTLEGFWRQGNVPRSVLSFVLLVIYTAAAMYVLRHNSTILPIPIVAAVVYIVSALSDSLVVQEQKQEVVERDDREWEREQGAKDRDLERQLKIADKKLKHEERLAKIKVNGAIVPAQSQHQISTKPAQEQFECEDCNRSFGTVQALNAHGRFCKGIAIQNGRIK